MVSMEAVERVFIMAKDDLRSYKKKYSNRWLHSGGLEVTRYRTL